MGGSTVNIRRMEMTGRMYGIGVGPGDPGLLTLKAKEILDTCDVIAYPVKRSGEESTALEIIRPSVDFTGRDIREFVFSMSPDDDDWKAGHDDAILGICALLKEGKSVAMVTLGDVGVYSTFMYIKEAIEENGYDVEIVPGIPSFCHGAALAGLPLVLNNEGLAIVPVAKENSELLSAAMDVFDNIVVMKAFKSISKISDMMESKGISNDAATVISNVGMSDQYIGPLDKTRNYSYFTTVIIKKNHGKEAH